MKFIYDEEAHMGYLSFEKTPEGNVYTIEAGRFNIDVDEHYHVLGVESLDGPIFPDDLNEVMEWLLNNEVPPCPTT